MNLSGYKTYITAGGIILSASVAYATGHLDVNGFAAALAPAALALPLRNAIAKIDLGRVIQALQAAEAFAGRLQSLEQQQQIAQQEATKPPNEEVPI